MSQYRTALIVGAGSGLSASLARLFSKNGMSVALAARSTEKLSGLAAETGAKVFACDATKRDAVEKLFADVEASVGAPDVVVYNASFRTRGPLIELEPAEVEKAIAVSAFGGFLVAQQAARRMLPQGRGAIFFTGASASVKGYAQSAPFAMGKFALRGLAQSMARELSPAASMWRISSSTAASGVTVARHRRTSPMRCSIPTRSRKAICTCCSSRAAPGPSSWKCGPGWRVFRRSEN